MTVPTISPEPTPQLSEDEAQRQARLEEEKLFQKWKLQQADPRAALKAAFLQAKEAKMTGEEVENTLRSADIFYWQEVTREIRNRRHPGWGGGQQR